MVCSTCIHVSVLVVNFAWFKILHALTPATHSYALLLVVIQKHTLELVGMGLCVLVTRMPWNCLSGTTSM